MNGSKTNIVLFDGKCNLCNNTVQFIIRKDPESKFRFSSLQSESAQLLLGQLGLPHDSFDSIVYITEDAFYIKSTAVLRILRGLSGGLRHLYILIIIPRFIRDVVYDFIAERRYKWYGVRESCMIPTPELQKRFLE